MSRDRAAMGAFLRSRRDRLTRQPTVSTEVLDALARVLRLDEVERAHLHDLAAPAPRRPAGRVGAAQGPDPGLLRVMATQDHVPVLLLGRRAEVLAHNALLSAVLGRSFGPGTSFMQYLFRRGRRASALPSPTAGSPG
jgi:hypothetical protein